MGTQETCSRLPRGTGGGSHRQKEGGREAELPVELRDEHRAEEE